MCTRRMPVHICVNISIPATRNHLPRGDTLAANRQCPFVAGTTVPVALRDRLKATLDDMVRDDIIEAVEEPTEWISSMVVIMKKDSKLRICLDPKDLNRAIRRENYQLPTIEDIATRLYGAKVFTVLDVRLGFWHVCLDDRSSYLTTFQTPFARYRYKRIGPRHFPEENARTDRGTTRYRGRG